MDYWLTPYNHRADVLLGCLVVYVVLGAILLRAACAFFNGTTRSDPPPEAPPKETFAAPAECVALEEAPSQGIQRREVGVKEVVPALPDEPEPPAFLVPVANAPTDSGEVPLPSFLRALGIAAVALVVVIVGHEVMDAFNQLGNKSRGYSPPFERELGSAFPLFAFVATAGVVAGLLPTGFFRACFVVFLAALFMVPIALVVGLGVNVLLGPAP